MSVAKLPPDYKAIGTQAAINSLLNTANTWTAQQTFSAGLITTTISTASNGDLNLSPNGTGKLYLNGASIPAGGSLTTGNVLQVSGAAALSYGPLNLAGGSNYVTGLLPYANLAAFLDGTFSVKNSADNTKVLQFSLSGLTTATTRTVTVPDASFTLGGLGLAQTWTGVNTFNSSSGNAVRFSNTGLTLNGTGGSNVTTLVQNSNEAANRTLNIPALGGNDTIGCIGQSQTWTGTNTFNAGTVLGGTTTVGLSGASGTMQPQNGKNLSILINGSNTSQINLGTAPTTSTATTDMYLGCSATTQTGLAIQMKASQTAAPFSIRSSTDAVKMDVGTDGALYCGGAAGLGEKIALYVSIPSVRVAGANAFIGFTSSGSALATLDIAFGRNAAGLGEITNGTTGTWRDLKLSHLVGGVASIPTIAGGTGAGTGPTVTVTTNSTDIAGQISVVTGTGPAGSNATIATITFNRAYGTAPLAIMLTPGNSNAAALNGATQVYTSGTTTTFVITSGTSALTASTTYLWNYVVIGNGS